ncbi:hypothetical protein JMJ35_004121 [Cladonia borealis]|uniref:Clr5 domain-containing protein n=1 Tax=Cladonia borealis TaxID=184061 RepID=A0AA39V8M8_9LECA|nr:hypothetical protein JMJ35_004121 [Cladonia borealis]
MANMSWPTLNSSASTTNSTTDPDFVDSVDFSDDHIDANSAALCTNAIALRPKFPGTTWALRAAATTNPEGWASAQDWVKHRALITELYPKLMLKEIMDKMAFEHNFKATEKMYKSRFTQWGLRKNAKRKGQSNQQSGREKRPIDRSRCPPADDRGSLIPIVSSGNLRTMKSTATLSHPLTTPPMLAIPERILVAISDYFIGSFEAGTWVSNGDGSRHCLSTKPIESGTGDLNLLYNQSVLACRLFDRSSFQDAGQALISVTTQTKNILLAEKPMVLAALFKPILAIHRRGRDEIAFAILRHFSAMAMAVLGDRHPICRISGWLSLMDPSQLDDIIDQCLSSMGDHFASLLGPMHLTALMARMDSMSDSGETEEKLRDLLGKCEHDLGWLDLRTLEVGLELSRGCYDNKQFTEAEELGQELLVHSQKLQLQAHKIYYQAESLYIIGMSQYTLGERHLGELNLLDAISMASEANPGRPVFFLSILEEWLLEQGREDSAAETRERRMKLQETFEPE